MVVKFLVRTAVAAGVVAGAAHLVRKHNLIEKAGELAERGVAKVESGIMKGIGLTDNFLTRFAEDQTSDSAEQSETPSSNGNGNGTQDVWTAATRKSDAS